MKKIFHFEQYPVLPVGHQGISQEKKKFSILQELGNKTRLLVWAHCEPHNGFGGPGGKALDKCAIFSLKLVYSISKIMKLKLPVSNKKTAIIKYVVVFGSS